MIVLFGEQTARSPEPRATGCERYFVNGATKLGTTKRLMRLMVERPRVMHIVSLAAVVASLIGGPTHPVWAATIVLPRSSITADCFDAISGHASGLPQCSTPNTTASVSLSPFVRLSAVASTPSLNLPILFNFSAKATLQYSFEVVGGAQNDAVPVLVDTRLSASVAPLGIAIAEIALINPAGTNVAEAKVCTIGAEGLADCPAGFLSGPFNGSISMIARSGTVNRVFLEVDASSGDHPSFPTLLGSASASADPFIHIDPSFAGASKYSILVSADVVNVPIPEADTGWFLAAGLGLLALIRGRASGAASSWSLSGLFKRAVCAQRRKALAHSPSMSALRSVS